MSTSLDSVTERAAELAADGIDYAGETLATVLGAAAQPSRRKQVFFVTRRALSSPKFWVGVAAVVAGLSLVKILKSRKDKDNDQSNDRS